MPGSPSPGRSAWVQQLADFERRITAMESHIRTLIGQQAGMVDLYAGAQIPAGALACTAAAYDPARYPGLFAAIGNTYGGTLSAPLLPPAGSPPSHMTYIIWT